MKAQTWGADITEDASAAGRLAEIPCIYSPTLRWTPKTTLILFSWWPLHGCIREHIKKLNKLLTSHMIKCSSSCRIDNSPDIHMGQFNELIDSFLHQPLPLHWIILHWIKTPACWGVQPGVPYCYCAATARRLMENLAGLHPLPPFSRYPKKELFIGEQRLRERISNSFGIYF